MKCPTCEKPMTVKRDKRGTPYATCKDCGAQLVVRGKGARQVFEQKYGGGAAPASAPAGESKPKPSAAPTPKKQPETPAAGAQRDDFWW